MDADEAGLIGYQLRRVRRGRGQGLRVISGLAGMSKAHLSRIERGERSPTLKEIYALADALQVSASELTRLSIPAPANGHTDSTTGAIGGVLDAIEMGRPGGVVLPMPVLREQVAEIHRQRRACEFAGVATALPGLIRNLHTTLATGTDHAELLDLAVYLHVHVTRLWLVHAAAPAHLVRRAVFLGLRLAQERDAAATLAVANFGAAQALLSGESFKLGRAELDALNLPSVTPETAGLVGQITASQAQVAMLDGSPGDAAAAMDIATELAGRFGTAGEVDSLGFTFGPTHAGICRVWLALEAGEPDRAVRIAQDLDPRNLRFRVVRVYHWVHYARALAQLPKRRDDAVRALLTAEQIFPTKVLRDPMVRDTLAGLLNRSVSGSVGRELRGMAYRAGLPV